MNRMYRLRSVSFGDWVVQREGRFFGWNTISRHIDLSFAEKAKERYISEELRMQNAEND